MYFSIENMKVENQSNTTVIDTFDLLCILSSHNDILSEAYYTVTKECDIISICNPAVMRVYISPKCMEGIQ